MHEASQDFMWLTESEWKSLVPAQPRVGQRFAVAPGISKRLFVYQLDPVLTHAESNGWAKGVKDIRSSELSLTVEQVSVVKLRLRMDGFALLGEPYDPAIKPLTKIVGRSFGLGYEPRILGYLDYDRRSAEFTRVDLVALGDMYGVQHEGASHYFRPGRQPLGVALELVQGDTPADRYPPRCARAKDYGQYFRIK
jgi:hypothetical protein